MSVLMRELGLAGLVAILFGLGSFYATDHFGAFSMINLGAGSLALAVALALRLRSLGGGGGRHSRPVILRGLAWIVAAIALGVALERAADWSDLRFDWTFERRFELAEATRKALAELPDGLQAILFYDEFDPRIRQTRLLLETLAREGRLTVREQRLEDVPEDEDLYGVGSSNTVVLVLGSAYETIDRPTEGTLYEALYRLRQLGQPRTLAWLRGEGEGDPEDPGDLGFSGFATALQTEGYRLRAVVSPSMREVPKDADGVLVVAPRREMPAPALAALSRYLDGGGRLVAFLEPGARSGLEQLLATWGLESPDEVVIDPASGAFEGRARGLDPVAYNYEGHPVTRGLDQNRMTFFAGARSFDLRRPQPGDEVKRLVLASPRSWLSDDLTVLARRSGEIERDGERQTYHPLAAAGRYMRGGHEVRIVAFGDSDFASNRYLRTLYNLDLALNAVHWAVQREAEITLRPKIRNTVQFPLPVQNSLQTLYGVGLLVPEILLIAGGVVWLRSRSS